MEPAGSALSTSTAISPPPHRHVYAGWAKSPLLWRLGPAAPGGTAPSPTRPAAAGLDGTGLGRGFVSLLCFYPQAPSGDLSTKSPSLWAQLSPHRPTGTSDREHSAQAQSRTPAGAAGRHGSRAEAAPGTSTVRFQPGAASGTT